MGESIGTDFSRVMPPAEAQMFMALMLEAQTSKHKCPFSDYFRKVV